MPARLELVADLAGEAAGAGLAHRVDREAAGAVEVDRPRAALDDGHLRDVVRGRLGRQRAEERQRHVDAVELVDVVLAAAAGARAARRVLRVLHAGDQLDQVAVLLADRQRRDLLVREAALDRGRLLVDERRLGRDGDRLGRRRRTPSVGVDHRVLPSSWTCALRVTVCMPDSVKVTRVVAGRQRRQPVLAVAAGHGDARAGQHVGARLDGDAGQHGAVGGRHLAADRAGLLGEEGGRQEEDARRAIKEPSGTDERRACGPPSPSGVEGTPHVTIGWIGENFFFFFFFFKKKKKK